MGLTSFSLVMFMIYYIQINQWWDTCGLIISRCDFHVKIKSHNIPLDKEKNIVIIYFLINTFVAIICLVFGLLIWKKGKLNLIHDYQLKGIEDLKGYGSAIGKNLLLLGSFLILNGTISFFDIISLDILKIILKIGILLIFINFFRIQKKYATNLKWGIANTNSKST